jgi:hypothetical protein
MNDDNRLDEFIERLLEEEQKYVDESGLRSKAIQFILNEVDKEFENDSE